MNRLKKRIGYKKKKNYKAFTLVELMAVIVIIGLLLGIAYPYVSKYINETRENDYALHEENMRLAATNLMSDCVGDDDSSCIPEYGTSSVVTLGNLIELQYSERLIDPADTSLYCSEEDSYVEVTNNGSSYVNFDYTVCLVCSNYKSDACSDDINNSVCSDGDSTNPVCGAVTGESTLWTNEDRVISIGCSDDSGCVKSTYYEKFTTTTDTGTITIEDSCGNTTDCSVNVYVDKEKPSCVLEIDGTLGSNGWYGTSTAPKVTFKSKTDSDSGIATFGLGTSGKDYDFNKSDSYTVSEGITTVYGYVKDNAGNTGYCSIEVKYDNSIPTQDTYYGYLVYNKDDISTTSGKNITLDSDTALSSTGVSSSNILSEYGNIYGLYVYPTSSNKGMVVTVYNGTTELKSITISSGVTTPVYFKFDSAFKGNSLKIEVANTKGGSTNRVSYVSKIEVLTSTAYTTSSKFYTNQDVTLYIRAKDSLSGKASYSFDGGSTWQSNYYKTYSANTGSLSLYTKDTAGNVSSGSSMNINNIDKVVPDCEITLSGTVGSNDWYTTNVGLTLSYSDNTGGSGTRYYYLTTSSSTTYGKKSTATQTSDTSSVKWYGYVIDKAGNTSSCDITFKKDATKPTCTLTSTNTLNETSQTATLTCSDSTSGLTKYYWGTSSSGTPNVSISGDLSTTKTVKSSGTYYLISVDAAGNKSTAVSKTYYTYIIKHMLQKVSGTAGTYNTTNYDTNSTSSTYIALSDTTLTSSKLYETPTGSSYVGYSTGIPSASTSTVYSSGSASLTKNMTVAYWFNRNSYTLTYDNQSGSGCTSKKGTYGDIWGTLCTPTRSGYEFKGWYTKTDGDGDKITKDSTVSKSLKVYAYWVSSTPTVTFSYTSGYVCPSDGDGANDRSSRNTYCHQGKYYNRMKITDASYDKSTGVITFKYDLCMNNYSVSWENNGYVELCIAKVGSTTCTSSSLASWKPNNNGWLSIKTCQGAKTVTVDVSDYASGDYKVIAVGSESFAFSKKDYTDVTFFTVSK